MLSPVHQVSYWLAIALLAITGLIHAVKFFARGESPFRGIVQAARIVPEIPTPLGDMRVFTNAVAISEFSEYEQERASLSQQIESLLKSFQNTKVRRVRRVFWIDGCQASIGDNFKHRLRSVHTRPLKVPLKSGNFSRGWTERALIIGHYIAQRVFDIGSWHSSAIYEVSRRYERIFGVELIDTHRLESQPSSLVSSEIFIDVFPLAISNDGITYSERYSDYFEHNLDGFKSHIPPVSGLILGFFGLCGISWGWWGIRSRDGDLLWNFLAFILGVIFWAGACIIVIPWSVS